MYTFGEGVDKDLNKAVEYYKLAGDAREGRAYNNLGAIYQKGMLGKVDHALAIKYFKLASDAGMLKLATFLVRITNMVKVYKRVIKKLLLITKSGGSR